MSCYVHRSYVLLCTTTAPIKAITGDSIVLKFEKARSALEESLRRVEDIVQRAIGCQVLVIVNELQRTIFTFDPLENQVGDDVIALLQQDINSNDGGDNNASYEMTMIHRDLLLVLLLSRDLLSKEAYLDLTARP
ncbi:hypothetical protein Syun_004651 [Stephania yunnanensis]|uniref:Uncharacterized protein n=1 Tax=Stephania yunnanensis TaxID=152371 RepID=A0AAP0Q2R6_9MAGN